MGFAAILFSKKYRRTCHGVPIGLLGGKENEIQCRMFRVKKGSR